MDFFDNLFPLIILSLLLFVLIKIYKSNDLLENFVLKVDSKKIEIGFSKKALRWARYYVLGMIIFLSLFILQVLKDSFWG